MKLDELNWVPGGRPNYLRARQPGERWERAEIWRRGNSFIAVWRCMGQYSFFDKRVFTGNTEDCWTHRGLGPAEAQCVLYELAKAATQECQPAHSQ